MKDFEKYEHVAMLRLSNEERETLAGSAGAIVESFNALDKIDTEGIEPLVSVLNINTVLREDIHEKLLTRDEIMANAPEQQDGYFRVPGTLE